METEHERLIGKHPIAPNMFAIWLTGEDLAIPPATPNKKHRKLTENTDQRDFAIEAIADFIIQHHVDPKKIDRIAKRKHEILKKYKLKNIDEYLETQSFFPTHEDTKTGNATEIILSNYVQATSGLKLFAYKLTYNPNVEQSIKGDDCLLFNKENLTERVIVGEAKFRSTPAPQAVRDIMSNSEGAKKLPISLPFISKHFTAIGDEAMAAAIEDLQYELRNGKVPVINVGLLLSTKSHLRSGDTAQQVDHYLDSKNPSLVVLSLGVDNPKQIIDKAFELAKEKLFKSV